MSELGCGYVQVYTGDGKGKTTSALGLCMRAAGHGLRSHLIQFMKGQIDYGELKAAECFSGLIRITQGGRACFVSKSSPDPEDVRLAGCALDLAREEIKRGELDILVLDEVNVAVDFKLIREEDVLELIAQKPAGMELILTGRSATARVIDAADLVTEMREIKHYYRCGIEARKGIER